MQTILERQLTRNQKQAYEGAKDFYHIVIPSVIFVSLCANIYNQWYRKETKDKKAGDGLIWIVIEGAIAISSYVIALKYYKLCNAIDTTLIINQDLTLQTIDKSNSQENHSQRLLNSIKPQRFYCGICKIICEYRTRHCRKCNVCIERYDHHCFWIGNCVGRHNHRPFYLFLAIQTVNNISVYYLISRLETLLNWQWWLQLLGQFLALGFCCFTGYLLIYHTMLVSCGITTWQHMRRSKISYLKYLPAGFNPFSKGIINNWIIFFTEQTRASGSTSNQTWQEQIVSFQDAKNIKPGCNIIENQYYSCC